MRAALHMTAPALTSSSTPRGVPRMAFAAHQRNICTTRVGQRAMRTVVSASVKLAEAPAFSITSIDEEETALPANSAWTSWLQEELVKTLVGVTSGTTRAKIIIVGVTSANMKKSQLRAEELVVLLQLEGRHSKEAGKVLQGQAKLTLGKSADGQDEVRLSDVKLDDEQQPLTHATSIADLEFAVTQTLGSAITERLNQFLWDVETKSRDGSMEELPKA